MKEIRDFVIFLCSRRIPASLAIDPRSDEPGGKRRDFTGGKGQGGLEPEVSTSSEPPLAFDVRWDRE